jgi:putative redox protein
MVKMTVGYKGDLRCEAVHGPSGSMIETDAPADNHGKAQRFSPTDLVGAALATCIATVLGIAAQRKGWDLTGLKIELTKDMSATPPRRIERLDVQVYMPASLPEADRQQVSHIAHSCPVHKSLHPDIQAPITIHWP